MIVGVRGWKKLWQICLMPPLQILPSVDLFEGLLAGSISDPCPGCPLFCSLPLNFRRVYHVVHFTTTPSFFVIMHGLQCFLCRLSSSLHPSHSSLSTTPHPSSSFSFFLSDVTYPLNTCLVQSDSLPLSIFSSFISRSTSIDVSCFLAPLSYPRTLFNA